MTFSGYVWIGWTVWGRHLIPLSWVLSSRTLSVVYCLLTLVATKKSTVLFFDSWTGPIQKLICRVRSELKYTLWPSGFRVFTLRFPNLRWNNSVFIYRYYYLYIVPCLYSDNAPWYIGRITNLRRDLKMKSVIARKYVDHRNTNKAQLIIVEF